MKAIITAALAAIMASSAFAATFPKVACYANTRSGGSPLVKDDGTLDTVACTALARFQLITLNVTPFADLRPDVVLFIRRANPSIKILAYDLLGDRWMPPFQTPGTMWRDEHAALDTLEAQGTPSWLYGADGARWYQGYGINLGNRAVVDALSDIWSHYAVATHAFDGCFLDFASTDIAWTGINGGRSLDYQRGGYRSLGAQDSSRRIQVERFVGLLRSAGGPCGRIIVGNGTTPKEAQVGWQGQLYEGWPSMMGEAEQSLAAYLSDGRPYSIVKSEGGYSGAYTPDACKQARFGLACASMGTGFAAFGPDRSLAYQPWYGTWWYDEYSVNKISRASDLSGKSIGWLGSSTSSAGKDATSGLWLRRFQNGLVLLNTTGVTLSWRMSGGYYWRIRGKVDPIINNGMTGTQFDVPPFDALFLVK